MTGFKVDTNAPPPLADLKKDVALLTEESKHMHITALKSHVANISKSLVNVHSMENKQDRLALNTTICELNAKINLFKKRDADFDHFCEGLVEFFFSSDYDQTRRIHLPAPESGSSKETIRHAKPFTIPETRGLSSEEKKGRNKNFAVFRNSAAGLQLKRVIQNTLTEYGSEKVNLLLTRMWSTPQDDKQSSDNVQDTGSDAGGDGSGGSQASDPTLVSTYPPFKSLVPDLKPEYVRMILDTSGVKRDELAEKIINSIVNTPLVARSLNDDSALQLNEQALLMQDALQFKDLNPNLPTQIIREMLNNVVSSLQESSHSTNPSVAEIKHGALAFKFFNDAFGLGDDNLKAATFTPEASVIRDMLIQKLKSLDSSENLQEVHVDELALRLLSSLSDNAQTVPMLKLGEEFASDFQELHQGLRTNFSPEEINNAIRSSIRPWLRAHVREGAGVNKGFLKNEFYAHVLLSLKNTGSDKKIEPDQVTSLVKTLESQAVLVKKGGFAGGVVGNRLGPLVFSPLPEPSGNSPKIQRQAVMPKAYSKGLGLWHRSGERFRMGHLSSTVSKIYHSMAKELNNDSSDLYSGNNNIKNVVQDIEVKRSSDHDSPLSFQFRKDDYQAKVRVAIDELVESINSSAPSEDDIFQLNSLFNAQIFNSGIDPQLLDKTISKQRHNSTEEFRLSAQKHGGLFASKDPNTPKASLEQKALQRLDETKNKNLAQLTNRGGRIHGNDNRVFLMYMANQQALWNGISPQGLEEGLIDTQSGGPQQPKFPLLERIGFNKRYVNAEQLAHMSKLVISAVGASTVRSEISQADVDELYTGRRAADLPLSRAEFTSALGGGSDTDPSKPFNGTLGSQVLDLMARLARNSTQAVLPKDVQMMGNLLTLMMRHAYIEKNPGAVLSLTSSSTSIRAPETKQVRFSEHRISLQPPRYDLNEASRSRNPEIVAATENEPSSSNAGRESGNHSSIRSAIDEKTVEEGLKKKGLNNEDSKRFSISHQDSLKSENNKMNDLGDVKSDSENTVENDRSAYSNSTQSKTEIVDIDGSKWVVIPSSEKSVFELPVEKKRPIFGEKMQKDLMSVGLKGFVNYLRENLEAQGNFIELCFFYDDHVKKNNLINLPIEKILVDPKSNKASNFLESNPVYYEKFKRFFSTLPQSALKINIVEEKASIFQSNVQSDIESSANSFDVKLRQEVKYLVESLCSNYSDDLRKNVENFLVDKLNSLPINIESSRFSSLKYFELKNDLSDGIIKIPEVIDEFNKNVSKYYSSLGTNHKLSADSASFFAVLDSKKFAEGLVSELLKEVVLKNS